MAHLERQARAPMGFVAASTGPEGGNRPSMKEMENEAHASAQTQKNPDAIEVDVDVEDDDD